MAELEQVKGISARLNNLANELGSLGRAVDSVVKRLEQLGAVGPRAMELSEDVDGWIGVSVRDESSKRVKELEEHGYKCTRLMQRLPAIFCEKDGRKYLIIDLSPLNTVIRMQTYLVTIEEDPGW